MRWFRWQIFSVAVAMGTQAVLADDPPAAPVTSPAELATGQKLKEAFQIGFQFGTRNLQQANDRMDDIRRRTPTDLRIDYAHGLILAKQAQMKQANTRFEAALEQSGKSYWPLWKGAIWTSLIDKQFETGLNRLTEFSILVGQSNATSSDSGNGEADSDESAELTEEQREAARWIGQILETVSLLPEAKKYKTLIDDRQSRIGDALGEDLTLSLEEGRELLRVRAAELDLAADVARDNAGQLSRKRKLDKELEALTKGTQPQTPEEWKKWIDDLLAKFDKELTKLDREYDAMSKRIDALTRAHAQAANGMVETKANMALMAHKGLGPAPFVAAKEQLVMLNNQMVAYEAEYNVVVDQMTAVAKQASSIADRRAIAVARYEEETGDEIPKNADLEKWTTRLVEKRNKMSAKKKAKSASDSSRKPILAFRTLMPLDFERERNDLLAQFGIEPPQVPRVAPKTEEAEPTTATDRNTSAATTIDK